MVSELMFALYVMGCICAVPFMSAALLLQQVMKQMVPSFSELAFVSYVAGCITDVPFVCAAIVVRPILEHMMPTRRECTRCLSEVMLLCNMWQGLDTNFVAVLAWFAWLLGLHCGSLFSCR